MNRVLFSSISDNWSTPDHLYTTLDREFHFTLDPCSSFDNHKTNKFFTKEIDGLSQSWANEVIFCNPPYSRTLTSKWVEKSFHEWAIHNVFIVLLLPARTDTFWFHEFILPYCEIRFLRGRLKFGSASNNAPFPSMVCIFRPRGSLCDNT